jgi:hypothetical protein
MDHHGTLVCAVCFTEPELSSYVEQNGEVGECSYCGRDEVIVAELDEVTGYLEERLRTEYSTADEEGLPWDEEEQRYFPESFDIRDVFDREFGGVPGNDADLRQALVNALSDQIWCQKDAMALTRREGLSSGWQNFCHNIKHDTRYLFFRKERKSIESEHEFVPPAEMLLELGELIREFDLVRVIDPGAVFYRVRWDSEGKTYDSPADLGPPPEKFAGQSRMSAAGIPMMYMAANEDTALAETRDSQGGAASFATFRIIEPVRVLEMVNIPGVPSILAAGGQRRRDNLKFLFEFKMDISRSIERDKKIHYEYSPTQVVTEYFRRAFQTSDGKVVEGVAYPSSRGDGDNVVLFFDRTNVKGVADDYLPTNGRKRVELVQVRHQRFLPGGEVT